MVCFSPKTCLVLLNKFSKNTCFQVNQIFRLKFSVLFLSYFVYILLRAYDLILFLDHAADKKHVKCWEQAKVKEMEEDRFKRWFKEAIEIRKKRGKTIKGTIDSINLLTFLMGFCYQRDQNHRLGNKLAISCSYEK